MAAALEIGSDEWLARRMRAYKAAQKPKAKAFRVTWWQYVNLGGLGREDRGTFADRKAANAYVAQHSAGMSAQDKRRFKIEAIY